MPSPSEALAPELLLERAADFAARSLAELGIRKPTQTVLDVVARAALIEPSLPTLRVTSTRLFLGIIHAAAMDSDRSFRTEDEASMLAALAQAVTGYEQLADEVEALRAKYDTRFTDELATSLTFSQTVRKVVTAAQSPSDDFDLRADRLVESLLLVREGKLLQRLEERGINAAVLVERIRKRPTPPDAGDALMVRSVSELVASAGVREAGPVASMILDRALAQAEARIAPPAQPALMFKDLAVAIVGGVTSLADSDMDVGERPGLRAFLHVLEHGLDDQQRTSLRQAVDELPRVGKSLYDRQIRIDPVPIAAIRLAAEISRGPFRATGLATAGLVAALQRSDAVISDLPNLTSLGPAILARLREVHPDPDLRERWERALGIQSQFKLPGFLPDDPSAGRIDDRIGVAAEAHAFARLSLARDIPPPFAVGIFGDWGSGKTTFMRLVSNHIAAIARHDTEQAPESGGSDRFHDGVVQIEFNAWHYNETNLWASLVDHIFAELDRWITSRTESKKASELLSLLATARRLTLEAAQNLVERRREQQAAKIRLTKAEKSLAQARDQATLGASEIAAAFAGVFQAEMSQLDETTKKAIVATGLDRLQEEAQGFKKALDELTDESRRGAILGGEIVRLLGSWRWAIAAVLTLLVAPAAFVLIKEALASASGSPAVAGISDGILAISGAIGGMTLVLSRLVSATRPMLDRLTKLRSALDRQLASKLKDEEKKCREAGANAAALAAVVEQARSELQAATNAVAVAIEAYAAESGFRRLQRFVRERAINGTYSKHLGLVATIRKDFEQLTGLMLDPEPSPEAVVAHAEYEAQVKALLESAGELLGDNERQQLEESTHSARDTEVATQHKFERIILYVDDLDRCSPEKVIDVLQAVHMLLYFRMFIVFVAVDARWVTRALHRTYPDLLAGAEERTLSHAHDRFGNLGDTDQLFEGSGATAHDYLEKIFQLPYWVKPLDRTTSQTFLASILDRPRPADLSAISAQPSQSYPPSPLPVDAVAPPSQRIGQSALEPSPPGSDLREQKPAAHADDAAGIVHRLDLGAGESAFIEAIASVAGGSPRRLTRFANVYRLVRSAAEPAAIRELEGGGYRALLAHLAISTGAPGLFDEWLRIVDLLDDNAPVAALRDELARHSRFGRATGARTRDEWGRLDWALRTLGGPMLNGEDATVVEALHGRIGALVKAHAVTARRYSFHG